MVTSYDKNKGATTVPRMTDSSALFRQAVQYHQAGARFEAEQLYKTVLKAHPRHRDSIFNLALLQAESGKVRSAKSLLDGLRRARPDDGDAHHMNAQMLERDGEIRKASHHLARAARLMPGRLDVHLDLVRIYGMLRRIDDARLAAEQALRQFPDSAEIRLQLGVALVGGAETRGEAHALFEAVLRIHPEHPLALYSLAGIAHDAGEPAESLNLYRRARAADHDFRLPPANVGDLELKIGAVDAAVRSHEAWLAEHPTDFDALSSRLLTAQYEPGMTAETLRNLHRRWDTQFGKPLHSGHRRYLSSPDPNRRLRLGLVSGDLRAHPVGYLTIRVVEALDPAKIEVVAYSGIPSDDAIAVRFKQCVRGWRDTSEWSDARLASEVERDRIDILIDLAGHTTPCRLFAFARKPAPVQVTWAGYPGTTGLSAMDAIIADRFHIPPGEESHYVEKVVRLPDGLFCFDPPAETLPISPPPAGDDGPLTFAAFHNPAKINRDVARLWARVLQCQPGACISFIYTAYDMPEVQQRIRGWFQECGIDGERLSFEKRLGRADFLGRYGTVDIALDTFPYSGGVTTCEALWMGVPVVTLPGRTFASRHSLSHLSVTGLEELVAQDADDYVRIVCRLGADRRSLKTLRSGLRDRVASSPLCDGRRFAHHLENLLRNLWRDWCHGLRRLGEG